MKFRVRNTFYLRLSASDVIPLYMYLDEKHVEWMTERTLASVISDLRPLVGPKVEAERYAHYGPGGSANSKKGTTEVHRSDTYQFAYFLRKAEPHAIIVKTRNYIMINKPPPPQNTNWPPERTRGKRKLSESNNETQANKPAKVVKRPRKKGHAAAQSKARIKKGKSKVADIIIEDSEEEAEESPLSEPKDDTISGAPAIGASSPRRSIRNRKSTARYIDLSDNDEVIDDALDGDVEMQARNDQEVQVKQEVIDPDVPLLHNPTEDVPAPQIPPDFGMDEDEEEKKLKPDLQLSFRGLDMRDRCLCVVVEPWPALLTRSTPAPDTVPISRAASMAPPAQGTIFDRGLSAGPSRLSGADAEAENTRRGETPLPLFLPDPSRDRSATPAPMRFSSVFSSLDIIDNTQYQVEDDDEFGMLAFSQALNNVAGDRIGAAEEDDDEMDGGALYGDADEMRGIME